MNGTMIAAVVFDAAGAPMRIESNPIHLVVVERGAALVKLSAATLCGSDVHTMEGKRNEPAPLVLGHEGVGVVEDSSIPGLQAGTRVSWAVGVNSCTEQKQCGSCRAGMPQKCTSVFKYGHSRWEGYSLAHDLSGTYASHIYLRPGTAIVPLTGSASVLPDSVVAPANCALATMVCAIERAAQVLGRQPRSVAIQGAGLLGLYGCSLALEACSDEGASAVGGGHAAIAITVMDTAEGRLQLAAEFGATCCINVHGVADDAVRARALEHLQAQSDAGGQQGDCPQGYDVVIEVCGFAGVLPLGVSLLRPGGVYVLVGLVHPASSLGGITGEQLIRKCACLVGVHNYAPRHLAEAIQHLVRHYGTGEADAQRTGPHDRVLPFHKLVSPPMPLTRMEEALACAKQGLYPRVLLTPE